MSLLHNSADVDKYLTDIPLRKSDSLDYRIVHFMSISISSMEDNLMVGFFFLLRISLKENEYHSRNQKVVGKKTQPADFTWIVTDWRRANNPRSKLEEEKGDRDYRTERSIRIMMTMIKDTSSDEIGDNNNWKLCVFNKSKNKNCPVKSSPVTSIER